MLMLSKVRHLQQRGMEYQECKQRFIEIWGKMASDWGVPPTMARIHALLLVSSKPLTADDIRNQLGISVGSVNTSLHQLVDWPLVHKTGVRPEYFEAEKDMWQVVRQIILHRKKKELDPVIAELRQLRNIQPRCKESEAFKKAVEDLSHLSEQANIALNFLIHSDLIAVLRWLSMVKSYAKD